MSESMPRGDRNIDEVGDFLERLSPEERAELFGETNAGQIVEEMISNTNEARRIADEENGDDHDDDMPVEEL